MNQSSIYQLAKNLTTISNGDVLIIKRRISEFISPIRNIPIEHMRIVSSNEWTNETFIDVYVFDDTEDFRLCELYQQTEMGCQYPILFHVLINKEDKIYYSTEEDWRYYDRTIS